MDTAAYRVRRTIPETHKMLNFMKIADARSYFWEQLFKRKLHVAEVQRGETWETSKVRFNADSNSSAFAPNGGRPTFGGSRSSASTDQSAYEELKALMEEALRVLSSIAKVENAKVAAAG